MSDVFVPTDLDGVFDLLATWPKARLMAGGTDLLVRLRDTPSEGRPPLVLLSRIPGLSGIEQQANELRIKALTSFSTIAGHSLVETHAPLLSMAARTVGGPAIRNMGTLGGNLVTASPAGDSLPPLYVMDARVVLGSNQGERILPVSDFVQGPGRTLIKPGEILTEIRIPLDRSGRVRRFDKVGLRKSLAIAVASFCGLLDFDDSGRVSKARFAWGSVGPTVLQSVQAEQAVLGSQLEPETIEQAVAEATEAVRPIDDLRASARYRKAVAGRLLARFLEHARQKVAHG